MEPKVHYHIHKSLPLVSTLGQMHHRTPIFHFIGCSKESNSEALGNISQHAVLLWWQDVSPLPNPQAGGPCHVDYL
jgi:hypothetical protein